MHELAVILVHWKDITKTQKCLEQVLKWTEIKPIIYLVLNEETENIFQSQRDVNIILSPKNLGYGGGNNLALTQSIGISKYSLLLNTDAVIQEAEVSKLLKCMNKNPKIFSTGPVIEEPRNGELVLHYGGADISRHLNTRLVLSDIKEKENSELITVDYTIGTILLLNNAHLNKIGLFDEDFFFSGEVADLCHRANTSGYISTTCLTALGQHQIGELAKRRTMYKYYNLRNRTLYISKHKIGIKKLLFWQSFMLKDALYFLIKAKPDQSKSSALALWHSIIKRYGNRNHLFIN